MAKNFENWTNKEMEDYLIDKQVYPDRKAVAPIDRCDLIKECREVEQDDE